MKRIRETSEQADDEDGEDAAPARGRSRKPQIPNARTLLTVANRYSNDQSGIRPLKRHFQHLESYTPGQDQAKSYVLVCTSTYWYIPVHTSTGIL